METESKDQMTRRAYVLGYKLLDTDLDEDMIYAKIEKQNVAKDIARQVAADIILERETRDFREERPNIQFAIMIFSLAIIGAIVSAIFTDRIVLSIGALVFAALYAARYYNKKPKA